MSVNSPIHSRKVSLAGWIFVSMVLGGLVGSALGAQVAFLGEVGKLVIQVIKALAAPLLFFAIVEAILTSELSRGSAARMIGISICNAVLALGIGLGLSHLFHVGEILRTSIDLPVADLQSIAKGQKIEFSKTLASYVPSSVIQPFVENAIIQLIFLALFFGFALRAVHKEHSLLDPAPVFRSAYLVTEKMISWVVRLVPLAVFGVTANAVAVGGLAAIKGLGAYVSVIILGLLLHILIVYQGWLLLGAKVSLKKFWAHAKVAVMYAFGASSSLATLPVTLKTLQQMKVSHASARMAACVGTNMNNDGIFLYEAMAVLIVSQAYGIHLSIEQQMMAFFSCLIAGIGIAGIPDAGLISLALVLGTVGLPTEILPLLLAVDWILSRARATTNVIGDLTMAVMLDRLEGKKVLS